jgi:hypothetical protein
MQIKQARGRSCTGTWTAARVAAKPMDAVPSALSRWPKPTVGRGWIAGERWWLHEVLEDGSHGWIGVLEIVSLVTLVAISAMAWLGVLAVLLESVA